MKKAALIFVAVALAAFGFTACGGDDDEDDETTTAAETTATETTGTDTTAGGGGAGGEKLSFAAPADGSFAFTPDTANAKAGAAEINFDNKAGLTHDLVLEDEAGTEVGKTEQISKSTESFTAELKPGTYTFYCSVPGHRPGGMEGTLTVK